MPGVLTDMKPAEEVDTWSEVLPGGVERGLRAAAGVVRDEAQAALARNADPWGAAFPALSPTTLKFYATEGDPQGSIAPTLRVTVENEGKRGVVRASGRGRRFAHIKQFGNPNNRMYDNERIAPIPARPYLPIRDSGAVDIPPETSARITAALQEGIAQAFARSRR